MAAYEPVERSALGAAIGHIPTVLSAAIFVWAASLIQPIAAGETVRYAWAWAPSLSVELSFLVDGLSLTFALLISGIGTFIFLFSNSYLGKHPQFERFILFLFAFELSMLGLVLADNLIALFVFWELTTVTSYLLIGFDHASAKSRRNALQALLLTGLGGLALLAGLILMGLVAGTFEISEINAQGDVLREHGLYAAIAILVLAGAFTKSAQVPFHFWLPNAMAAPTPVSAYLHSATMVKAGVYLMARLHPSLSGTDLWLWALTIAGGLTAVWASILALKQTDLKQALAYTTLMALGTLTLFLASPEGYALEAVVAFLIVHSLYKAALFMIVGAIDHETGTREVDRLRGLARLMPVTAIAVVLATLSMAGVPPFFGFIGKELMYAAALDASSSVAFVAGMSLAANAMMVVVALVIAWRVFFSRAAPADPTPIAAGAGEAPVAMWIGPLTLGVIGAVFGVFPGLASALLVQPGVSAVAGEPVEVELYLWHGVNLPLMMSLATFALGGALYLLYGPLRAGLRAAGAVLLDMDRAWDRFMDGVKAFAGWQTAIVQPGLLRTYMATIFGVIVFGLLAAWFYVGPGAPPVSEIAAEIAAAPILKVACVVLTIAGVGVVLVSRSRVSAVAGLGVVGVGVALLFILFGAPDVAITQLLVETLVVVLLAVAMLQLPFLHGDPGPARRPYAALVAVGGGAMMTLIVMSATLGPLDLRITEYFEATAWPDAFGRNIVNVILVDFRALDTFGEIAVVAVAALSAFALLKGPKILSNGRRIAPSEVDPAALSRPAHPATAADAVDPLRKQTEEAGA